MPAARLFLLTIGLIASLQAHAGDSEVAARTIGILSFIGADYPDVVEDGRVLDQVRHREQLLQLQAVSRGLSLLEDRPGRSAINRQVQQLQQAVARRAPATEVQERAGIISDRIAAIYRLPRAPAALPSPARGRRHFNRYCAGCHGLDGRGDSQAQPPVPSLADPVRMANFSLYDIYNLLELGVPGAHQRFGGRGITSADRWAVAVYSARLLANRTPLPAASAAQSWPELVILPGIATTRPVDLPPEAASALIWWRGNPDKIAHLQDPLQKANGLLAMAAEALQQGEPERAYRRLLAAYGQGYLPVAEEMRRRVPSVAARIDEDWRKLRQVVAADASRLETLEAINNLRADLQEIRPLAESYHSGITGPTATVATLRLILRLGLELVLLALALQAVAGTPSHSQVKLLLGLFGAALVAGLVAGALLGESLPPGSTGRAALRGSISLLLLLMFLGSGLWLILWRLRQQMPPQVLPKSRMRVRLTCAAVFLVFFHEVLVIRLLVEDYWQISAGGGRNYIVAGLLFALATLIGLLWYAVHKQRRSSVARMVRWHNVAVLLLAVIFTGHWIKAWQAAGWIPSHGIGLVELPSLGVYPTFEGIGAQLLMALLLAGVAFSWRRPPRRASRC
ncbi:c-type cytochrome [Biformimicrobium ophioploci]|uniref:Cytochrome c/FTR1 family iron permease n=1 Tax=Biformimicrobium ophioploci TaxID=3036711 RepID=A0ABQ6LVE0_9GAMM|nr:cytochrome c [Microbulbifer sp. NKW57]GMG85992.1 cytochrome c/FTR1 family iron permease [Microbulbifer sp. NKW57]